MQTPIDHNMWVTGETRPTATMTTNSFHAPQDSESELDEEQPVRAWKPFARDIQSAPYVEIVNRPVQKVEVDTFVREHSTSTSVNGNIPAQAPLIDYTSENPWVEAPLVHMESIRIGYAAEDYDDDYYEYEDEYDRSDDDERSDYIPYEYDTEDKESVNGQTQISETRNFQRIDSHPIVVLTSFNLNLIVGYR